MYIYYCKRTPRYIEEFSTFAGKQLGLNRLTGEINISYHPTLEADSFGLCWGDRKEVEIHIASRSSTGKISRKDKMCTVAHEFVHARQYLTNQLSSSEEEGMCTWMGEAYKYDPELERDEPWELEAASLETPTYEAWLKYKQD
jgi:hypothetical protein